MATYLCGCFVDSITMYTVDETRIDASHFRLLAENGEQVAIVATVNLDVNAVVGVLSFHEYEGTFVVENGHPNTRMGRLDTHHILLDYYGDAPTVVRQTLDERIRAQENSDDETRFTWQLITGTESVRSNEKLVETLDTTIGPERLEPEFDIPEDAPIATLDVSFEAHEIIKEANEYRVGVPVDIHRHRGETYLIGLTTEYAKYISQGIHDLQMEYQDKGFYESAETAEHVEGKVLHAEIEPREA